MQQPIDNNQEQLISKFETICQSKNLEALKLMMAETGLDFSYGDYFPFRQVARYGWLEALQFFLEQPGSDAAVAYKDNYALFAASMHPHLDVIKVLATHPCCTQLGLNVALHNILEVPNPDLNAVKFLLENTSANVRYNGDKSLQIIVQQLRNMYGSNADERNGDKAVLEYLVSYYSSAEIAGVLQNLPPLGKEIIKEAVEAVRVTATKKDVYKAFPCYLKLFVTENEVPTGKFDFVKNMVIPKLAEVSYAHNKKP